MKRDVGGRTRAAFAAALGAIALSAAPLRAHEHWLEVEPFQAPAATRPAKVYLFVGDRFTAPEPVRVRTREAYAKFEIVSAGARQNVLKELREDQAPLAVFGAPPKPGSHVFSLEALPRNIELPAKKFQSYLLEERLIDALILRAQRGQEDAPGRERYSRSLKAIAQIGPKLEDHVTKPVGSELEIVPLAHPYGLAAGAPLTVQVLFKGKPLAGRAVTGANRLRGDLQSKTLRTDAAGKVTFPIARRGDWMFALVHIEPTTGEVDWRSYWATLTFSLGHG
jgi:hypothetical protein